MEIKEGVSKKDYDEICEKLKDFLGKLFETIDESLPSYSRA